MQQLDNADTRAIGKAKKDDEKENLPKFLENKSTNEICVKPLDQNITSMPAQFTSNQSLQNATNINRDIAGHYASGNASLANITPEFFTLLG